MMARASHPTDELLAVVGPRSNCTPNELRAIGAVLRAWLTTHEYARQVYGLDDLEVGRKPMSPASYVIFSQDRFPDECWPVALLAVAAGTAYGDVYADLVAELGGVRHLLAHLTDPVCYDEYTR